MNVTNCQILSTAENASLSCCKGETSSPSILKKVDVICRIAIGVFGMIVAPCPLLLSFSFGFVASVIDAAIRNNQNKPMYPNGVAKPVCAQGYMDFLSGMRFPPIATTLATTAFIGAHLRHDPQFYAPFCGLFLGVFAGRESFFLSQNLKRRISQVF